jgi:hypothetical protein
MNIKMSTLMLYCKTYGEVFPGIYIPEGSTDHVKTHAATADTLRIMNVLH